MNRNARRQLAAEAIGSFFLFATVIGSGIMAERLAGGNVAIALLGNTMATGAILFVLINMLGPISGAHFNPAVTTVAWLRKDLGAVLALVYVAAQLIGGIAGVWTAHLMFDEPILQLSTKARTGIGQWTGEFVATFGLILTILGTLRWREHSMPASVALYITAAYWFTSSTSFANPAITAARSLSDSFAGISPQMPPLSSRRNSPVHLLAIWPLAYYLRTRTNSANRPPDSSLAPATSKSVVHFAGNA